METPLKSAPIFALTIQVFLHLKMKINITQRILFYSLIAFYLFAGYNHFAKPSFYLPIIPPYLSAWAKEINILSGIVEIILALLLIPKATRSLAVKGIIIMLIAFIPTHIYFIQKGYFVIGSFRITPLISYIRLFVGQPILILWAWWSSKIEVDLFKKYES
jgi:uncharacterized membrane protein